MIRNCGCGRSYTKETWRLLRDPKEWWVEPGVMAEQRLCYCGSHISVEVPMVVVIGVVKGLFYLHVGNKEVLSETRPEALAKALGSIGFVPKNHTIVCSSSMDFPEEDGAPGLDARRVLREAVKLMRVKA